ncbi:MAG: hypothetical protein JW820_20235 [Spirochaetales bacterium]|nr:hypothetical protein [Spirochaetales bacterium]
MAGLPGIVTVRRVPGPVLARVLAEEERYGSSAILPVLNLGVRVAAAREVVFAVLKDRSFRPPPAPTVYLVEESEGEGVPPEQQIEVDGRCYRILGEEVLPGCAPYTERNVSLGDSFVMFPGRRGNAAKPSYFLVPPLGFSELEEAAERLGIRGVFSISPSASADALLRELCGLPMDTELATLLVGFDRA